MIKIICMCDALGSTYYLDLGKELVGADSFPKGEGVVHAIDSGCLGKSFIE